MSLNFSAASRYQMPPKDEADPVASLDAMDDDVSRTCGDTGVDSPVLPCQKPWLEVLLFDGDRRPVEGSKFIVDLPDGTSCDGKLDARGYVHVDDVDVNVLPEDLMMQVTLEQPSEGPPIYRVAVIGGKVVDVEDEDDAADEAPEVPEYFGVPWGHAG